MRATYKRKFRVKIQKTNQCYLSLLVLPITDHGRRHKTWPDKLKTKQTTQLCFCEHCHYFSAEQKKIPVIEKSSVIQNFAWGAKAVLRLNVILWGHSLPVPQTTKALKEALIMLHMPPCSCIIHLFSNPMENDKNSCPRNDFPFLS